MLARLSTERADMYDRLLLSAEDGSHTLRRPSCRRQITRLVGSADEARVKPASTGPSRQSGIAQVGFHRQGALEQAGGCGLDREPQSHQAAESD